MQDQKQQQQCTLRDTYTSSNIISSTLNHIFTLSQQQIKLNTKVATNMNPYTSIKVSSLINQIGQLIYQQAQQSDAHNTNNKTSILNQVEQTNIFPKDNMFTTGASIMIIPSTLIQNQKDDITSINSYKTSFSRPRKKTIMSSTSNNIHRQTKEQSLPQNNKLLKNRKNNQVGLVDLKPGTKTGRSRSSAFDSSNQNNQQKILQQTIDQYRDQKIMEEQAALKHIQNKKKMTSLLSKDQMILSFGYQGDFVKISKRQFNIMMEKKANVKMAQSVLVPGNYRFWKTKQKNIDKNQNQTTQNFYQTKQSQGDQKDSKFKTINKKPHENKFKRTSIDTINEMKKNSIQICKKKVIKSDSQNKVDFQQYKKNLHDRGDSSFTNKSNKPLTEEQLKAKSHKMQFLTNKLSQYHQKPQNSMPQWIKTVQNGCKVRIFVGKKQSCQNLLQNNKYNNDKQQVISMKNKQIRSYSQPRQNNQHRMNQNEELGMQLKCVSNLKSPQREQSDLMAEWQKRKLIKTIDIKQDQSKNLKGYSKNVHTSRRSKSVQPDNFELSRSITDAHVIRLSSPKNVQTLQRGKSLPRQIQNKKDHDKQISQLPQHKTKVSQRKSSKDFSNNIINNEPLSNNQQTTINLNLQEFKIVKGYLQSKNIIFQKKQSISKYRTESILDNRKLTINKDSKNNGKHQVDSQAFDLQMKADLITIAQESNFPNNNHVKNEQYQLKSNKNVTFSQIRKSSISTEKKVKNQGSINVTNQRLKNSLLGSTSQIFISPSSILYTKRKTQNDQNITQKNKGKSIQVSQLQRISQSQKSFLPIQSENKSKNNSKSFKQALSLQKQKSVDKKLSIIQKKHHSTVLKPYNMSK